MDIIDFNQYLKKTESAFNAENEIIEEKLGQGINGLEWLVLQIKLDDCRIELLDSLLSLCKRIYKKDFEILLKDAMNMDNEQFYAKHELNWWTIVYDSLTYLALLKETDYDRYFDLLQFIYE